MQAVGEVVFAGSEGVGFVMRTLEHGQGYRYAHDESDAFAAGENYFPDGLHPPPLYEPVPRGLEIRIGDKLRELRARNAAASKP